MPATGRSMANPPHLDGCRDVDLEAPAMTNALPVRRMGLPVAARGAGSRYIPGLVNAERRVATGGSPLARRNRWTSTGRWCRPSSARSTKATRRPGTALARSPRPTLLIGGGPQSHIPQDKLADRRRPIALPDEQVAGCVEDPLPRTAASARAV